jgi:putative zinc ribbon protein
MKQISKNPIKANREEKRVAKLKKEGRIVKDVEIPEGVLAADSDAQNSSGFSTKFYYKDIQFTCAGCGKEEVWTAPQQKRYFETQKGNIYNEPKWCYDCHSNRTKNKN